MRRLEGKAWTDEGIVQLDRHEEIINGRNHPQVMWFNSSLFALINKEF